MWVASMLREGLHGCVFWVKRSLCGVNIHESRVTENLVKQLAIEMRKGSLQLWVPDLSLEETHPSKM